MATPPDNRLIVSTIEPVPVPVHVEPLDAAHVQVAADSDAGSVSAIVAPTTFDGPAFAATIV